VLETLVSLAIRQRRTMVCPVAAAGKETVVVIYPPDEPVQAIRPPIGLLNEVDIVPL
jgi:hypothetical protein